MKDLYKYVMFNNTLRILGFIILAIAFNIWWISLFSILFLMGYGD